MYKVSAGLLKCTCKEHNRATALEMHAEIYKRKTTNGCRGNMLVQQHKTESLVCCFLHEDF